MDTDTIVNELRQKTAPPSPCAGCGDLKTLMEAIQSTGRFQLAVWYYNAAGELQQTVHREDFPVKDLRETAEQFAQAQHDEELRSVIREEVAKALKAHAG